MFFTQVLFTPNWPWKIKQKNNNKKKHDNLWNYNQKLWIKSVLSCSIKHAFVIICCQIVQYIYIYIYIYILAKRESD